MIKKGCVTHADFQKHIRGEWRTIHNLWPHIRNYVPGWGYSKTEIDAFFEGESGGKKQVDWARITSKPGTYPPSAHTLASHSTKAHSELSDAPPDAHHAQLHAASHHTGGGDLVNHDSLTGFEAAEHLSLPNTIANVLSDHNKEIHDALDLDAHSIDGVNIVAATPSNNEVLTYDSGDSRWEAKTVPAGTLAGLTDTNIGAPEAGEYLQYSDVDSKWHNISDPPPAPHHASHESAGSDQVNHDSLAGFVGAEHLSLPNTIANVLSNHTKAVHDALDLDAHSIDGVNVVAATPTDGHVLTYVQANTRWEDKPIGSSIALGDLTDVVIGAPEGGDYLMYDAGQSRWENVTDPTAFDSDRLDGYHGASISTINTYSRRDASGDISTRLFRSEYDTTNATCNYIMTQIDTASNNYIRPSTKAQLIASLALMKTTGGTFTGAVYARDHGPASYDEIVNVCYGTGNPPSPASDTTIGTLFVKYAA